MRLLQRSLLLGMVLTAASVDLVVVSPAPASADCTQAGYATICADGVVTGGGPTPVQAGPVYPGYCADPWYCSDDWGLDIAIGRPGRPGRPGGPR